MAGPAVPGARAGDDCDVALGSRRRPPERATARADLAQRDARRAGALRPRHGVMMKPRSARRVAFVLASARSSAPVSFGHVRSAEHSWTWLRAHEKEATHETQ